MDEKKEYIPARLTVKAISFADIVTTSPGAETPINNGGTNSGDIWDTVSMVDIGGGNNGGGDN